MRAPDDTTTGALIAHARNALQMARELGALDKDTQWTRPGTTLVMELAADELIHAAKTIEAILELEGLD